MAAKVSEFGDSIMWHVTWLQRVYFETRNAGMNMTTEPTATMSISTPPSSVTHRAYNFALVSYFMYIIRPFYYSLDASYQFETLICSVSGFNIASMKEHGLQSFLLNLIHNQGWIEQWQPISCTLLQSSSMVFTSADIPMFDFPVVMDA